MDKYRLKENNKGLSLVEIIIVLAIMSALAGILLLTTSMATDKHVNSCALKIEASLEQTRSMALGKQGAALKLWQDGDGVWLEMFVNGTDSYGGKVNVGRPGLTVTIIKNGSPTTLDATGEVIHFSRSNGSVTDVPGVTAISVTNGDRIYEVYIDTYTGKVTSEMTNP
ncbi:MAG: prepilin-type N-terminal cleavage/methylation domain-containing protein [Lachnospiraceae bacterium]|nr:prepilin-type N-terminal cleavage/methylation domain-containing protein [Lachnospiraceae bacterium]